MEIFLTKDNKCAIINMIKIRIIYSLRQIGKSKICRKDLYLMEITHEGFRYEAIGDDLVLKGCDPSNIPDLRKPTHIPAMINGKTVVGIGRRAFSSLYMSTITFPATISDVAEMAFAGSDIEHVRFVRDHSNSGSKSLRLGERVFENCYKLKSFDTSQMVSVGWKAFSGCVELDTSNTELVVLNVQEDAFASCRKVKSLCVADYGTLKTGSMKNSSIESLRFANYATFEEGVLEEILEKGITVTALMDSPILDIAYLGIQTMEEMPF